MAIVLYFNPKIPDPFNDSKFWILLLGAAWLSGWLLSTLRKSKLTDLPIIYKLAGFMFLSLTFSFVLSDNKFKAIFGDFQRRNGYFTYVALLVFLLTVFVTFSNSFVKLFSNFILFISVIESGYGFLQSIGRDPVPWKYQFNPVIGTLGNPNFSSAVMSILSILLLIEVLNRQTHKYRKFCFSSVAIFQIYVIYCTKASQGLISLILGLATVIALSLIRKNQKLLAPIFILGSLGMFVLVLALNNKGPLASMIYKSTISIRGYYWRAGIEMFKHNIFTGVGIDNYNDFFKQFRELKYAQEYGYQITSSNAHNIYIQFFATGGLFLGISILLLFFVPVYLIFQNIRNLTSTQIIFIAAWVAYLSQAFVSIDNIGISILGWSILGILYKLLYLRSDVHSSNIPQNQKIKKIQQAMDIDLVQIVSSVTLLIFTLLLVSNFYVTATKMYRINGLYNGKVPSTYLIKEIDEISDRALIDPTYRVLIASYLYNLGEYANATSIVNQSLEQNPRNLDALALKSQLIEQQQSWQDAVQNRLTIQKLDPWNAQNLLSLGKIYLQMGDSEKSKIYFLETINLAKNQPESEQAKKLILNVK